MLSPRQPDGVVIHDSNEVKQMERRTVQDHGSRWSQLALLACAIFVVLAYVVLRATT